MSQDIPLDAWLARLRSDDAQAQIQALRAWPRDPRAASPDAARVWKAIEHLALKADDPQVRQAALNALTSPAAQQFYHRRSTWPPAQRAALRAEIASWVAEGLLSPAQAAVLQARYADPPRARPRAEAPRAPRRASPWALQVVLYLGAFFVISAALLFAALVEAWRLPILLLATGFFAVAAAAVYRITPTGGRVLGIVAAGFLWADAAALADILKPHLAADGLTLYWALATAFLALAWLAGGWLLRSFVLTLAAWPMLAVALSHGFLWLRNHFSGVRISWLLLAWAGETILAVLVARLLRARQPRLSKWLWGMTHLVAGLLVFGILPLTMIDADEGGRVTLWLPALLAYAALMLFYLLARYQIRPLPWVEAWAVPLSIAGMLQAWTALWPAGWPQALVLVAAALALATVSILLRHSKIGLSAAWSLGLEILTGLAWWAAGLALLDDPNLAQRHIWALIPWLLGAAWGWAEAWRDRRWVPGIWGWVLGLNAFIQFVAQVWPGGVNLYWSGWLLLPLLGSVALDAWAQRRGKRVVLWVARGGAFLLAGVIALQMITALGEFRLRDAGVLLMLTLLLAGYARALGQPWLWAGVPVLALYTWGAALDALDAYHPAALSAWPVLAAVVAWLRARSRPTAAWYAWGWGTLIAAWLTAGLALFYSDGWSVLALAMMATVTGGFAWLWHPLTLALPTAGLYFAAYAWTLNLWHVRQPQSYTVPAAALGLLLHGLYRRRGHPVIAFVLGALSQLVLFTTTYFQMLSQRSGLYFAVLFLQALVVLAYGLWSNDPALIWTPIGFVVLATVTMVLIQFQGLGVLALLCGSGLALLAGGLFLLWRRSRRADEAATAAPPEGPSSK